MKTRTILLLTLAATTPVLSGPAPSNSELVIDDNFDRAELGDGWHVNTGDWRIEEGVLTAREIKADKHSAAARCKVATGNAAYDLRFRLTGDVRTFHVGFDPSPGQLDKKGHLFSVIVTPGGWKIMKHLDKNRPEADPNEVLASEKLSIEKNTWHTLRVVTWGPYVTATLNDGEPMKASHPTFAVAKPTVVFRCVGDGIEIDDLKVWSQK